MAQISCTVTIRQLLVLFAHFVNTNCPVMSISTAEIGKKNSLSKKVDLYLVVDRSSVLGLL